MKKNSKIITEILNYLKSGNPLFNKKNVPLDKSLVESGYLDSFGIVELVVFLEKKYKIKIEDSDITKAKFGSLKKMEKLIISKKNAICD